MPSMLNILTFDYKRKTRVHEKEQLHTTLPIVIPGNKIVVEMLVVSPIVKTLSTFYGKTMINTVLTNVSMPQVSILPHVSVRFHYVMPGG